MSRKTGSLFAIVGACAVGTLMGLAVGLMVAPQSGDDLRDQIASKGKDLYNKAMHKKNSFEDDFEDFKDEFEDSLDEGLDEAEEKLDKLRH